VFFFEKKNQKTFANLVRPAGPDGRQHEKVFCFFFSKKKCLLLSVGGGAGPALAFPTFDRLASTAPPNGAALPMPDPMNDIALVGRRAPVWLRGAT
jgi:hypothetical protein